MKAKAKLPSSIINRSRNIFKILFPEKRINESSTVNIPLDSQYIHSVSVKPTVKKSARVSVRRSVRRSVRLLKDDSLAASGSMFSVEEVPVLASKLNRPDPVLSTTNTPQSIEPHCGPLRELDPALSSLHPTPASTNTSDVKSAHAKRRRVATIVDEDKENIDAVDKRKKRRRRQIKGMLIQVLDTTDNLSQSENLDPHLPELGDQESRRADSLAEQEAAEAGSRPGSRKNSTDISLPDCVRRSLTGEFVPPR